MNGIVWGVFGTGIAVLAPVLLVLWRRRLLEEADTPPTRPQGPAKVSGKVPVSGGLKRQLARRFHGISLKVGPNPCQTVRELAGQRFLPEEAPALPLAGCDQQKCQCAYSHHSDRRDAENRRSGWGTFGGFTPVVEGGNRRAKARERRAQSAKV